jgi:hypothetical protein
METLLERGGAITQLSMNDVTVPVAWKMREDLLTYDDGIDSGSARGYAGSQRKHLDGAPSRTAAVGI